MLGLIKKVLVIGVLAAVGTNLGGCNDDIKKKNVSLMEENTRLRTENENFDAQLKMSQARSEQLQGELNNRAIAQPQGGNSGYVDPGTDYTDSGRGTSGGAKKKSSGGGGGGKRLEVSGDVLFGPGSVDIKSGGKKELDGIVSQLKGTYASNRVRVEGYTDTDKPVKVAKIYPTNEALSQARADSVKKYLVSKGISSGRIDTVGKGAANPKSSKAASRRVEIVILGK